MKTISIVNIKGGVGKTVSTVNIAACLQEKGNRVLVVDLDPQGNCSHTFKNYSEEEISINELLMDRGIKTKEVIKNTEFKDMDIIPSNQKLQEVEEQMIVEVNACNRLNEILMEVKKNYDYCLIDCPPSLNIITRNALVASKSVIVPIKIDQYAIDGLGYLIDSIEKIREELNKKLKNRGFFITMDAATSVNKGMKKQLKQMFEDKMLNTTIRNDVKVIESTFYQMPVVFKYKRARASKDYRDLVEELFVNGI